MLKIAVRYALFAIIATAVNLGAQWLVALAARILIPGAADPAGLPLILGKDLVYWSALVIGTGAGFLVKYVLDKKFIFYHKVDSFGKDVATFALYLGMAIVTTLVFWTVQWLFAVCLVWEGSQYVGGLIGLSAGYTAKYFLDRRFVFVKKSGPAGNAP